MSAVEKILRKYQGRIKEEAKKKDRGIPGAKTAGQVEAELKLELKSLLRKWKKAQEEKAKKKEEEEEEDSEHSPSYGELSAVLWRNSSYNNNCYKYLKKNGARRKTFEMSGREARLNKSYVNKTFVGHFLKYYGFGQRDENFSPNATINEQTAKRKGKKGKTAGNAYPYAWNGHHMIPCGSFYQGQTKKGKVQSVFTDDQYALLLMSDYNVNHGQNVIPLPDRHRFYQPVHDMVRHPGSHPKYTKMVQREMKEVAKELKKLAKKADEPHPNISVDIAKELANFEDDLWDEFKKMGKDVVDAMVGDGGLADLTADQHQFVADGSLK